MGQRISQNSSDSKTSDKKLQPVEHSVPEEIFVHILSYVDIKTLINLRLVCHWWKHLIDNEVWRLKVSREKYKSLKAVDPKRKLPWFVYYVICAKDPFEKNVLKNHCAQDSLTYWDILSNGGDEWAIEDPPQGADALPQSEEFGNFTSCFATSYHSCSKEQVVDLLSEGMNSKVLDEFQPIVEVSEWYAGRFDCGCLYEMNCELLNERAEPLTDFICRESVEQWEGGAWHKVSHVFQSYGPGVRFIKFYHGGMDTQFWAGHYGSKMSGACIKLRIPAPAPPSRSCSNAEDESDSEDHVL